MATTEDKLTTEILDVLTANRNGLEASEITTMLVARNGNISPRGVRNALNRLAEEGEVIRQKRKSDRPGAPSAAYFHKDYAPRQLDFLKELLGVADIAVQTKAEAEREELDAEERERAIVAEATLSQSALEKIAFQHVHEEGYAQGIIAVAESLAAENPIDIVLQMACWVIEDLNNLADEIRSLIDRRNTQAADKKSIDLAVRLGKAHRYFHQLWRLDPGPTSDDDILHLPSERSLINGSVAWLNEEKARRRLTERIQGSSFVEKVCLRTDLKVAAGTDASVADLTFEHARGSFIPPDSVAVTTSAASLVVREDETLRYGYQDFDIFPQEAREYGSNQAAIKGLILSPSMKDELPEDDFKHSRLAAMDLRQYNEDMRVVRREADWRPVGGIPALGIDPKPSVIFRDGRALPSVHRLKDFESTGLYGRLVQSQIQTFSDVVMLTLVRPGSSLVYGAVVKNPDFTWLASLVFWYMHVKKIEYNGALVVPDAEDVYRAPFPDTAVSHLLFLGLANKEKDFQQGHAYRTFRILRRFSDIADVGDDGPPSVEDGTGNWRLIDEDNADDWQLFIEQRVTENRRKRRATMLETDHYGEFIHLCAQVGVSMFYGAPTYVYEGLVSSGFNEGGHFLLPRLENTVLIGDFKKDKHTDIMLSWLASGGCELDRAHTQSAFDNGTREQGLPILVPDVIVLAHEAAAFGRNKMSEEVGDQIQLLIAQARKMTSRTRS